MVQQTVKHNRPTDRNVHQTEMSVTYKSEFQTDKNIPTFKKIFLKENTICMGNVMQCAYKCTLLKLL